MFEPAIWLAYRMEPDRSPSSSERYGEQFHGDKCGAKMLAGHSEPVPTVLHGPAYIEPRSPTSEHAAISRLGAALRGCV